MRAGNTISAANIKQVKECGPVNLKLQARREGETSCSIRMKLLLLLSFVALVAAIPVSLRDICKYMYSFSINVF